MRVLAAGVYTTGPLTINISGVAALNPAMAGQVQTNPALAGLMFGSINQAAVPIEEGWVKLRGLDPAITKEDICTFFQVRSPLNCKGKHPVIVLSQAVAALVYHGCNALQSGVPDCHLEGMCWKAYKSMRRFLSVLIILMPEAA